MDPDLPAFDLEGWREQPYARRLQQMCQSWAVQGFGAPNAVYLFYLVKVLVYVGVWALLVASTPEVGGLSEIGTWWAEPIAFQKAVLWSLAFEGLGLGSASGPLTARYVPPFGGSQYFLRPGTTRLPPFPGIPFTDGYRRTVADVGLYVVLYLLLARALVAAEITGPVIVPVLVVLGLLGLRDKTAFLATRADHYLTASLVFLFPGDLLAGSKVVQAALWFWAATSKLNHHFPAVITVMVSNSPVLRWRRIREAMYRGHPNDLRPSRLATWLAHVGTAIEYSIPVLLLVGQGGWVTLAGLTLMTAFHLYITSSVPMGVPIEWNVFFLYSGFALFGVHAEVSVLSIGSPVLIAMLAVMLLVVPLTGNLWPAKVSFLFSMRYYAGNWATSLWAFREGAIDRLDQLVKVSRNFPDQLRRFYDETTTRALMGKAQAFRSMHLHGRALNELLLQAVDDPDRYDVLDGEGIAGIVLGWNFGDGHLHHEQLLEAVQTQCGFRPGELRCVFLESQPLHRQELHWRIADAAEGRLDEGHAQVSDLRAQQPWPQPGSGQKGGSPSPQTE
ncbi:MAG: DUF3556 domain-containing protein [Actinobacteria bacterium]|nr:DUF3556 domain-containing protein [Actinomycetota bacterium]